MRDIDGMNASRITTTIGVVFITFVDTKMSEKVSKTRKWECRILGVEKLLKKVSKKVSKCVKECVKISVEKIVEESVEKIVEERVKKGVEKNIKKYMSYI